MRMFMAAILLVAALPSAALAQTTESRGVVSGMAGGGKTWDDEGQIGNGVAFGGHVEYRLFGTTGFELAIDRLPHTREGGFFESEGTTWLIQPTLLHRFGRARVQPYVLGGITMAKHEGTTVVGGISTNRKSTDFGYHFGGGFAVRAGRVEVGPEVRFYVIQPDNDFDPAWAYWFGIKAGVRF
jgi:hypothetical protein